MKAGSYGAEGACAHAGATDSLVYAQAQDRAADHHVGTAPPFPRGRRFHTLLLSRAKQAVYGLLQHEDAEDGAYNVMGIADVVRGYGGEGKHQTNDHEDACYEH